MRIPTASLWSAGIGVVVFALSFLGVPRPFAWVLLALGLGLIVVAALFTWEASSTKKAQDASFPDVAIEVTKQGNATVPHSMLPTGTQTIAVYGLKLVNHETQRSAVLTLRLFQDLDLDDGAPPEVVCAPFLGDHPQGKHTPPVLQMPLHLSPGAAVSGDVMFELNDWGGKSNRTPTRLEVEDDLSGAKFEIPPNIGRYRRSEQTQSSD